MFSSLSLLSFLKTHQKLFHEISLDASHQSVKCNQPVKCPLNLQINKQKHLLKTTKNFLDKNITKQYKYNIYLQSPILNPVISLGLFGQRFSLTYITNN